MRNETFPTSGPFDRELDAYNAAFYELGLRWHWDCATWAELQTMCDDRATRVRCYLEKHQSHLLRAYDSDFLVAMIEHKAAAHLQASEATASDPGRARSFDWAQARGCELGI